MEIRMKLNAVGGENVEQKMLKTIKIYERRRRRRHRHRCHRAMCVYTHFVT